ncbi:MAG: hypothetical protein AAF585_22340, partial [Verrucomicrobiota bacterium]
MNPREFISCEIPSFKRNVAPDQPVVDLATRSGLERKSLSVPSVFFIAEFDWIALLLLFSRQLKPLQSSSVIALRDLAIRS